MTTSHGPHAKAPSTACASIAAASSSSMVRSSAALPSSPAATQVARKRSLKRKKPTQRLPPMATALSPGKRNQLDDGCHDNGGDNSNAHQMAIASALPLEVVFLNRYRRTLRSHITLTGWNPVDADLKLLVCGRDGTQGHVASLTLDDCSHITVDGVRFASPVLAQLQELRLRRCSALHTTLVTLLPVSLVEIDLSYCEWLDDNAVRLLARRCVALRKVSLSHCRRLTDYGVSAFAPDLSGGGNITELDMSLLPRVSDTCLLALLLRCPKLTTLVASSLSSFEGLTMQGLPRNTCAPSLAQLDLSRNTRMHFLTVTQLVRVLRVGSLVELNVSHCGQLTDDTLVALGRHTPSLRVLRVAFCTQLSDVGATQLVQFVAADSQQLTEDVKAATEGNVTQPRCTHLRLLDLSGCFQITSEGIAAIARHCGKLETLLGDGLRRLDATGLACVAACCPALHTLHWGGILIQSTGGASSSSSSSSAQLTGFFSVPTVDRAALRAISAMRALHTLHIGATACDVDALARHCLPAIGSQLRALDASGIATDALCTALATHCTQQLTSLRLSKSRYFSESAFLRVAVACGPRLRALDLESCEQLTDQALFALATNCTRLEKLILSNDWQITERGVVFLTQRCCRAGLVRLQLRHCPEVSPQCLREIAQRYPLIVATKHGLEPKAAAVAAFVRLQHEMDDAARRLTRWLRDCLADRTHATSAIDRALRHIRRRRRCAVRIQRCIRKWLSHCRHRALVEQARLAKAAHVDAQWRWVAAYCMSCRVLRGHLRKWLVRRHEMIFRRAEAARQRRESAATDLQRVFRGWTGRQRAAARRAEVATLRALHVASTLCIQRVWRGAHVRHRVVSQLKTQCLVRLLHSVQHHERQLHAVVEIARVMRGTLGRRRARQQHEEREQLRQLREQSARILQRSLRAYFARVVIKRRLFRGATALQRLFRGLVGRRAARRVVLSRSCTRAPVLLLLCVRSVFTRELAMQWKRKRDAASVIACNCQNLFRGYYYGRLVRRRVLAEKRQLAFIRDASARCLQHFFRSLVILRRLAQLQAILHKRTCSALQIQKTWRMWLGKVRFTAFVLCRDRSRRHAATLALLSSSSSSADTARLRILQFGAIHLIATTYRLSLRARGWQKPSYVRFLNVCATKIQSLVRGHQSRRYSQWYAECMTWAARMVQRVWRGKLGRKQWRVMAARRRQQLREQEERDRAARIASKRTGEFVLYAHATYDKHARVLQQWARMLQRRQVFTQAREIRAAALRGKATDKLTCVVTAATAGVVFQARVWRECLDHKQQLSEMEDSDVRALESEIATLKRACLEQYVAHATAVAQFTELHARKKGCTVAKKTLKETTAKMKATIQPFAQQVTTLTLDSARVHVENRQLQDEMRRLRQSVAAFHEQLQATLPLEPLLYENDVERLVDGMGLMRGGIAQPSLLQHDVDRAIAEAVHADDGDEILKSRPLDTETEKQNMPSTRRCPYFFLLVEIIVIVAVATRGVGQAQAQAIAAPDKGDELEARAFVDGQGRLDVSQRAREPDQVIDINIYSYETPTQFVMGLLLDPCRHHAFDCCSDRFGEPAYTNDALVAKEKISLLDESGAPFQVSASRLSDRPSMFDPDCYVDSSNNSFYRLRKQHTTAGLQISKQYDNSGCVGRLRALAPMDVVVAPPCWDRNGSINALESCHGVDGRKKPHCVAVAYMQTGLIVQCFGAYALDNHCGTFLEVHEPGSETILSQTRLLGEYTSGFRTTTLPLFFRGDRTRTICRGSYEIWWVQRTRYNFIVQKKKKFAVVEPPCDFDFATNKYKNFHRLAA